MDVLLVDDHPLIQEILPAVVSKALGQATIHVANSLQEAFEHAGRCDHLDFVLLDLGLPGCSGIESLNEFLDKYPAARVVVVSAVEDRDTILAAFKAGAVGYIPKTSKQEVIIAALKVVAAGGIYVPREVLESAVTGTGHPELSERQLEVLRLMLNGLPNRSIAKRLEISENTVKHHIGAIYGVLGTSFRAEAMATALRRGFKPAA